MGRHSTINKGRMWRWKRGGGGETTRCGNDGSNGNNDDANGDSSNAMSMMAAVTMAVAAAIAMTMGCYGNGFDIDNDSNSSGGNDGDDDNGNYYLCEYDQLSFDCIHLITAFPYGFEIGAIHGHCCEREQ